MLSEEQLFKEVEQRCRNDHDEDPPDRQSEGCRKAREELRQALRNPKTEALSAAIKTAAAMQLYPVELKYAQEVLTAQRKRDALTRLEKGEMSSEKDVLEAEALGITDVKLNAAKERMHKERKRAEVRDRLRTAVVSGDLQLLSKRVMEGEEVGLTDNELQQARSQRDKMVRNAAAVEALTKALQSRRLESLQAAVSEGHRLCLRVPELGQAEAALHEEERKHEAWEEFHLQEVKRMGGHYDHHTGMQAVRQAIGACQAAGFASSEIESVAVAFREEERRDLVRRHLKVAEEQSSLASFVAALTEAEAAGLPMDELRRARQSMVEARKVIARKRLQAAIKSQDRAELNAALAEGTKAGLQEDSLSDARAALKNELMKEEARAKISRAMGRRRLMELRAAVYAGEIAQLSDEELAQGREALRTEERKHAAREAMEDAAQSRDVHALSAAIKAAESAGITAEDMQNAKTALDQELKASASRALGLAVRARRIDGLEVALAEGVEVGLSEAELEIPQKLLHKLVRERAALLRLRDAKYRRNIEDLKRALEAERVWAAGTPEYTTAQEVLAEEERKERARKLLLEACKGNDMKALKQAIDAAFRAGVSKEELKQAHGTLSQGELRDQARAALEEAQRDGDIATLRAAIEAAEQVGLSEEELAPAKSALPKESRRESCELEEHGLAELTAEELLEEERKMAARRMLKVVEKDGTPEELLAAMGEAYAAGLDEWEYDTARKALIRRTDQFLSTLASAFTE